MKKIKILEAIRQGQIGGGETHVLELCTYLDKSRFEPVVLSFTDGPMVDELKRRGIKTKVIYTEKAFDYKVWKQVRDFIQEEQIDIVHAHGTRANSNVFWATKKLKLPLIYTVHGWSFHLDQKFFVRKMRELSEKFLTNKATKTICVSKSNEQDGINRFNMKRSSVIYNAVNIEKFNPANTYNNIRQELGISPDKTVIGYIVRITAQKDPFTMLRAMKKVAANSANTVLLMVGDGDLKEKAIQLANELQIQDQVIFQPFRTDIPDILNAIDIYALPSLWEGFPIGIIEAMAMEKCIIASPVDGTKELVEDGVTGFLVEHGNPDKLADAIQLVNNDINLRNMLAKNAYQYVTRNFGMEKLARQVEQIYENHKSLK
ncbi:MAG: glycosyltransferase family 4 protein [Salinivirgaceae bacterium]|nr:glycosyltransferase family 4 protein [Salinivirgaceae bacterium]